MRFAPVAVAVLTWAGAARADLDGDANRLVDGWKSLGQQVVSRRALFLEQGKLAALVDRDAMTGDAPCVSVAVLSTRGREVVAHVGLLRSAFEPPHVVTERGAAGVAFFTRCGASRTDASETALEMKGARGTVEVIVARGAVAAVHPAELLREREVGAMAHPVDPGRAFDPTPLASRIDRAVAAVLREQPTSDGVFRATSNAEGGGVIELTLPPGCHTLTLLADRGAQGRVADLDAELTDVSTRKLITRDRSETPDVRLTPCVAEATRARLAYVGAPPATEIAIVRGSFPLAAGVPRRWPGRARAAISALVRDRPGAKALGDAVRQAQGTVGTTSVSVDLVPGCQRVVAAAYQGEPRALMLSARVAGRLQRDDGGLARRSASMLLCPREPERAVIRVDARGVGVAWVLGVFSVSTDPTGAP